MIAQTFPSEKRGNWGKNKQKLMGATGERKLRIKGDGRGREDLPMVASRPAYMETKQLPNSSPPTLVDPWGPSQYVLKGEVLFKTDPSPY